MNLFLAPAAAGNIQKSITNGVRMTLLERYLSGRDLRQLKDVLGRDGPYHCFAMTENKRTTFEGMDLGDEVMLTITGPKKYDYICQVAYKIENEEFGRALWEHTPNKPWKLIYFVKDVLEINIDKAELAKQSKYKRGFRNSGVMRVRSELTTRIISTHGSIREFVMRMSKGELPQVSDQGFFEVEEAVQVA